MMQDNTLTTHETMQTHKAELTDADFTNKNTLKTQIQNKSKSYLARHSNAMFTYIET